MRILIVAIAAFAPLASSAAEMNPATRIIVPGGSPGKICANSFTQHAQAPGKLGAHKLGEMPPGDLVLAVQREVDGCIEPVIVRHDIGGQPTRRRTRR